MNDPLVGPDTLNVEDNEIPNPTTEWSFKVSSKHLMLASQRFKKMLTGGWSEATTVYSDGCRHVDLEHDNFDPEALQILLHTIHGKTSMIPRFIDLEMLAKVAVLVDDFECYEELEIISDIRIRKLECSLPTDYNRDVVLWILICGVFHKPTLFERVTSIAITHGSGLFETLNLPISEPVSGQSMPPPPNLIPLRRMC
jgi:hypothetical protein